ncbi:hypothetical protein [Acinetobacter ursingii]|uniref:Uncharacterized protein n=1 Tax=Acinetobacter ursingii TaxID=108980 RepID=A0AA46S5S3_9GAMM|nr:hypothetical protein [Acinetobacter ursingii]UYF73005.1 hypothetical protein LSO60_07065 [Acinetobacter ursingii]
MNAHKFLAEKGIKKATRVLNESPSNAQSYQDGYYFRTTPEFLFHNGHHHWNVTTNNGQYFKDRGFDPILISELKQVVESFENIEFYGGFESVKFKIKRAEFNGWLCISAPHEDGFAEWYVENAKKAIADHELVQAYKNGDA